MTALAWLLLALGALVLVLTQVRLRSSKGGRGMTDIAPAAINGHTGLGLLAGVIVALRLLGLHESGTATWVAIVAMAIAALLGLAFLARWRGSGGRHSVAVEGDSWTSGPWLSQIAHIGYALGTVVFIWLLLSDRV